MATAFTFKIEKGIAPPSRCFKYPFDEMEVGDSFLAPDTDAIRRSASAHSQRHGQKFSVRKVEGGARVWRIA